MRYLFLLTILAACNSEQAKPIVAIESGIVDSLSVLVDTTLMLAKGVDTLLTKAANTYAEIKVLRQEKKELLQQLEKEYPASFATIRPDDEHLRKINELNGKLIALEFENTRLKRKISQDSAYQSKVDKVPDKPVEYYVEKPNQNSVILQLDRKLKVGEIPIENISVYILPYNKKSKKLMTYENCDMSDMNGARQADLYNGQYFFNGIAPGKYLIKICYLYGGYKVIERTDGLQVVAMQVAPPIQ